MLKTVSTANGLVSPTFSGNVTLSNGNIVPATAGKGIDFSANTGTAGMTSELLNWYEEGTWTPNQGAGLIVVGAFSSSGIYTRIGRQVTISGAVQGATSIAIAANSELFSNAPFSFTSFSLGSAMNATGTVLVNGYLGGTAAYISYAIAASGTIYFQFVGTV
jgi:hypothetical protein